MKKVFEILVTYYHFLFVELNMLRNCQSSIATQTLHLLKIISALRFSAFFFLPFTN